MVGDHLIGAATGQVIVCDSVTINLYKLACAALDARHGRDVIVTDDDNFPTDRYVLQGVAAQRGCELRVIHTDIDDRDQRPRRWPMPWMTAQPWSASRTWPTAAGRWPTCRRLTGLVHRPGAMMLWDLCHSVGAVPVELDASRRRHGHRLHL